MTTHLKDIPRPEKRDIARKIHAALETRQAAGPPEPALDAYIEEVGTIVVRLETHVEGRGLADAARATRLARAETADIGVDTWLRHIEGFLRVEASRREGPHVLACKALYDAACPDGLAHVDDRIVDENACCRAMLEVLRAPEHAPTLAAVELPPTWLDELDAALTESEAAISAVIAARDEKSTHVDLGRNADLDWIDLMLRLRRYVASRAKRTEVEKLAEGRSLLLPLTATLKKMRADAATRATRRAAEAGSGPAESAPVENAPPA